MKGNTQTIYKLPLPKWCFILLGIPTFYMPLAYLSFTIVLIIRMLTGTGMGEDFPSWMMMGLQLSLYVTLGMWPVYIAWAGFSQRLVWREKGFWLFVIVMLNMVGMPMFYVFMIRRYLGIEGRKGKSDEIFLNNFLKRHQINKEKLSSSQMSVLQSYCHNLRLTRLGDIPLFVLGCLLLYTCVIFVPKQSTKFFADLIPTKLVIIDSASDSKEEIMPDSEHIEASVQMILLSGAMSGFGVAMSLSLLVRIVCGVWVNREMKTFIDFIKVSD